MRPRSSLSSRTNRQSRSPGPSRSRGDVRLTERRTGRDGDSEGFTTLDLDLVDKRVLVDDDGPDGGTTLRNSHRTSISRR